MCHVIPIFIHLVHLSPFYDSRLFSPPWSVAVWNSYNHFFLDKVGQHVIRNTLVLFQHNPTLCKSYILMLLLHVNSNGEKRVGFTCEAATGNTVNVSPWLALTTGVPKLCIYITRRNPFQHFLKANQFKYCRE